MISRRFVIFVAGLMASAMLIAAATAVAFTTNVSPALAAISASMGQVQTNSAQQTTISSSTTLAENNNNISSSSTVQEIFPTNITSNNNNTSLQSSIQIRIDVVKQLPPNTPNTTSISNKCERNNFTVFFSQNCQEKFIGKTNNAGQILLSRNTFVVVPRPPFVTSYVLATVIDNNQSQQPIENAIVDGIVNSTDTFAVDSGRTAVTSAFVHALKADMSDWTYINWRAPEQ